MHQQRTAIQALNQAQQAVLPPSRPGLSQLQVKPNRRPRGARGSRALPATRPSAMQRVPHPRANNPPGASRRLGGGLALAAGLPVERPPPSSTNAATTRRPGLFERPTGAMQQETKPRKYLLWKRLHSRIDCDDRNLNAALTARLQRLSSPSRVDERKRVRQRGNGLRKGPNSAGNGAAL